MSRLLILGCSATKRPDPGLLSALDRYDGPHYRVLRAWRRAHPATQLDTVILSAELGLIDGQAPIAWYDRVMDVPRAQELAQGVEAALSLLLAGWPTQIFISLGRRYMLALPDPERLAAVAPLTLASGSIGQRLKQMKGWLWGRTIPSYHTVSYQDKE